MITKCTIYGERCSGTNYIENLISINFDVNITWQYGWKHFFGHNITDKTNNLKKDISNADDVLFICIVRDIVPWINSFFKEPHHVNKDIHNNINCFINNEIFTPHYERNYKKNDQIPKELINYIEDRNFNTNQRYKNLFELRYNKINYMTEVLPKIAKNYIFVRYEDLINNFQQTMFKIKSKGLVVKSDINFPLNSNNYKNNSKKKFSKKKNLLYEDLIYKNENYNHVIENKIGYKI